MTPTARTLAFLRRAGYLAAVVESWLPHTFRRRDLFGFADVPELAEWLKAGGAFEVHGWAKRKNRWTVRRVPVRPEDLENGGTADEGE
jgi:hypothetical protein